MIVWYTTSPPRESAMGAICVTAPGIFSSNAFYTHRYRLTDPYVNYIPLAQVGGFDPQFFRSTMDTINCPG
jgi:hypothetical protein